MSGESSGYGGAEATMSDEAFWSLIAKSRELAEGDPKRQMIALHEVLRHLSRAELEAFASLYMTLHERAYRWDLWDAGQLVNDGMGDDSFGDFRDWLISRGREVYERTLADPDSLADLLGALPAKV